MPRYLAALVLLLSLPAAAGAECPCKKISLSLGAGYYLNGADFLFPQETTGNGPIISLAAFFRPRPSLSCGLEAGYAWCRRQEWVPLDESGTNSIDFRGRLDVLPILAVAALSREVPELKNTAFVLRGGLGVAHYRYAFSALGMEDEALDVNIERKTCAFSSVVGLGARKAVKGRLSLWARTDYLYVATKSEDPDLSGFAFLGGVSCQK